jgi:catechol 2,3-dioxygenase-like lactoylglutathione lyase family enzyme
MKLHLNLATRDLEASVAFYQALLGAKPTKHFSDYALFLTEEPGLELALDLDPSSGTGQDAHYGIVVESASDVEAAAVRFRDAGYPVEIESGTTCCYAVQDKVWATDPDGRRWETYFVLADTVERDELATSCC